MVRMLYYLDAYLLIILAILRSSHSSSCRYKHPIKLWQSNRISLPIFCCVQIVYIPSLIKISNGSLNW